MRIFSSLIFVLLILSGSFSQAHQTPPCEQYLGSKRPITLRSLRAMAQDRVARNRLLAPAPAFDNIEELVQVEQRGEAAPLLVQQVLGNSHVIATPAPTSDDDITIGLVDESKMAFAAHVDIAWKGKRTSTAIYAGIPGRLHPVAGGYLVGEEFPVVYFHLHGGGTPTATGKNSTSIMEKFLAAGIPVLAPDLPGHGRATRQLNGLTDIKDQVDWVMAVIARTVPPGTKVVLGGHSWGGMFATYMHRLSADPKYAQIVHYIALSPGVDTSLGGSAEERDKAEAWYDEHYKEFEKQIASGDFQFRENMERNGKDSDSGALFTGLFNLGYSTPVLSAEQHDKLKPLTVVTGTADGLVYVGLEKYHDLVFSNLNSRSQFVKLEPAITWKSKNPSDLKKTGHQVFDHPDLYPLLLAKIKGEVPDATFPEAVDTRTSPAQIADAFVRNYATFIGFREMAANTVEYVDVQSDSTRTLAAQKTAIDSYLKKVDERMLELKKVMADLTQKALTDFRAKLGMQETLSIERANEEAAMPELTVERRAELEAYVAAVMKIDDVLKVDFKDPESERALAELAVAYAGTLKEAGIDLLEGYKSKMEALPTKGDKAAMKLRGDLMRLHQAYTKIMKDKQGRFGSERNSRLASLKVPSGVADAKAANRELRSERSPERAKMLHDYIAGYGDAVRSAELAAMAEIEAAIAAIKKPEGIESLTLAHERKAEIDARMMFTYAPPGAEDVTKLAQSIAALEKQIASLNKGSQDVPSVEALENAVRKLRKDRAAMLKRWDNYWTVDEETGKALLTSPGYRLSSQSYEAMLQNFKKMLYAYETEKKSFLIKLKNEGRDTAENIAAGTPELLKLRERKQQAKKVFLTAKASLDVVKWNEALHGALEGATEDVADAAAIALKLWGEEYSRTQKPSQTSLSAQLKAEEDLLEARRSQISLLLQDYNAQRVLYVERMKELGQPVPYDVATYPMLDVANQTYADLISQLESDRGLQQAMTSFLSRWEAFATELRRDSQTKTDSGY